MVCYYPLDGYRAKTPNEKTGKRPIVFNKNDGLLDMPVQLPCGQCIGCRLERSRQWAIRCVHEASLYESNCFITLTYSPEHLSDDYSLKLDHWQKFMKRLRKKYPQKIRFFHCGEYGEKHGRPHYHAILFNHDFQDRLLFKQRDDVKLYTSDELQTLWPYGHTSVGDVTFESAAYVARYVVDKITGDNAEKHYEYINPETGEIHQRKPEYCTMSRNGGIGGKWWEQYSTDVTNHDFVVIRGQKMKPPKFYDRVYQIDDEKGYRHTRGKRVQNARSHKENNTSRRLRVREQVQLSKLKQLKREVE